MNPNVKKLTQAKKEVKCDFCHKHSINELEYGPLFQLGKITVHQFCMMFSSDSRRSGEYNEGIMGHCTEDLLRSLKSSARFGCKYCKEKGGSVKCMGPNCKVTFHYTCGVNNGSLSEFVGKFPSYCFEHRPKLRAGGDCKICHGVILRVERCVVPACCHARIGRGLHWTCVQQWALVNPKGGEFRCPICQSKDEFILSMQKSGVYTPAHHPTAPAMTPGIQNGPKDKWDWEPKNDDQLELFEKAKENLHLVLVSFKEGLRLTDAFHVMFTQASIKFPLEEMGFENFYHFLYHCPEIYWIRRLPESDEMYLFVRAKVDANVTHIRSLIQQQRFHESSAGAVRVTSGTTYAEDPSYLLRFRGRPCEKLPAFRPKPAQDFGPAKEKDPPVVVDLKPLNPGGQTSVILPKASIKKQKHLKSIMMNRKGTGTDSAEPQEYDARLLRVDCHGWFYLRKITRNNYHWEDYRRNLSEFYEKEKSQQELKLPREEVFRGAQVVAYYRKANDCDLKVYGRCTILDYNLDDGTCNVQDVDDSQVGLAALDELYFLDEFFGEEPPGAIKVLLAGTEPFLLTGHVLKKFKQLNVCAIVKVNVVQEFHPIFECPVAKIQAWDEDCYIYRDLKVMLGIS